MSNPALSPNTQLAMLVRMHDLIKKGSQFVIATHSPILMAYPDADIYLASENGLQPIKYEETEHFQVSRYFLNNHRAYLERLLTKSESAQSEDS